jgi:hypothetical protein
VRTSVENLSVVCTQYNIFKILMEDTEIQNDFVKLNAES